MKAMSLVEHGGPEVLGLREVPDPVRRAGHVIVDIKACGLNHLDLWVRRGLPNLKHHYPHVLGADAAGVVSDVGDGVSGVTLGDEVVINPGLSCGRCKLCLSGRDNLCRDYGLLGEHAPGCNAPRISVPACNVVAKPKALSFHQAAAMPVAYLTAWQMLVDKARVVAGETVFIHAAGSGVGIAALQICRLLGAKTIASASSEEKRARARELGADEVVDANEDIAKLVRKLTDKRGVDVVFEHTGEQTWQASILMACKGGRIVTCGATSGFAGATDLRHVFYRQLQILGSTMAPKSALYDVMTHAASGALAPVIGALLPLTELRAAHELLEARKVFGKVVMTVG